MIPRLWELNGSVLAQSGTSAQILPTKGFLMHKKSKPQPFSVLEYLSGNETLFLSEK